MYSIVMLMAMSGAPEMPAFGGRGCHGGHGGCHGGAGWGGGCHGGHGGRFGGHGGCHGGRGGMFGGRGGRGHGHGCHGGHHDCCGGYAMNSCGCMGMAAPMGGCGCCGGYAMGGVYGANTTGATVVVNLPADAKLFFDGAATTSTTANRRFTTPTLVAGADMNYTLTAEIVREGKTLKATQVITVRGGQITEVNLTDSQFASALAMN